MEKRNRKGFSLIELLAVIVILGVLSVITVISYNRYISYSKEQAQIQLKKNVEMAAKSFLKANSNYKPKNIGSVQKVPIRTLIEYNYIKESDFKCVSSKKCDMDIDYLDNAYVNVTKESNSKYSYEYIDGSSDNYASPGISNYDLDSSGLLFTVQLDGVSGETDCDSVNCKDVVVASYAYVVYVDQNEVYNSGFLAGGKKDKVLLKDVDISKFVGDAPADKISVFIIVTNNKGLTTSQMIDTCKDSDDPRCSSGLSCGNITGASEGDVYLTKKDLMDGKKRTVSVKCIGSGKVKCRNKGVFTKTWDKDSFPSSDSQLHPFGTITIKGTNGSSKECPVPINIDTRDPDKEGPILKIRADNKNGQYGFNEKVIDGGSTYVINIGDYSNTVGDLNWLNKTYYPNGIAYHVEAIDDREFDRFEWELNASNKSASASKSDVEKTGTPYQYFNEKHTFTFDGDGKRYAKLTAYDKAGNKTTVKIYANLDHTAPNVPTAKIKYDKNKTSSSALYTGPNSRNPQYKEKLWWGDFSGTDAISGTDRYEYAINCSDPTYTGVTNSSGYTKPNSGSTRQDSCYKIRQRDKAKNYSSWSGGYYLNIDLSTSKPTTFTGRSNFGHWLWMSKKRSSCDYWSAKYKGDCPESQYGNVLGRVQKSSYSDYSVKLFWEIINGPETYIYSSYTVDMIIYEQEDNGDTGSHVHTIRLKSAGSSWDGGSYNYGWVTFTVPKKGDYEVHFRGNPQDPNYNRYMGWFRIS